MVSRVDVSMRDAADLLDIDPTVLARLCRYLHVDCREQRIPLDVLDRAGRYGHGDERYAALRTWLLDQYVTRHTGQR